MTSGYRCQWKQCNNTSKTSKNGSKNQQQLHPFLIIESMIISLSCWNTEPAWNRWSDDFWLLLSTDTFILLISQTFGVVDFTNTQDHFVCREGSILDHHLCCYEYFLWAPSKSRTFPTISTIKVALILKYCRQIKCKMIWHLCVDLEKHDLLTGSFPSYIHKHKQDNNWLK